MRHPPATLTDMERYAVTGEHAETDAPGEAQFVHDVLFGLADLDEVGRGANSLVLPLGLSIWLRRSWMHETEACQSLRALRHTLLGISALDAPTEPVPIGTADPRTAVVNLAAYLHDLLGRAARSLGTSTRSVAELADRAYVA